MNEKELKEKILKELEKRYDYEKGSSFPDWDARHCAEKAIELTSQERDAEVKQAINKELKIWEIDKKKIEEGKYENYLLNQKGDKEICNQVIMELETIIQKLGLDAKEDKTEGENK